VFRTEHVRVDNQLKPFRKVPMLAFWQKIFGKLLLANTKLTNLKRNVISAENKSILTIFPM
jgi:hypothetical protein